MSGFDVQGKTIAVIGDVALDVAYFAMLTDEASVETGLPVNDVRKVSFNAGGAGNLAVDVVALGAHCDLYGFCGTDTYGTVLEKCLKDAGVSTDGLFPYEGSDTCVYHKMYQGVQEENRFDVGRKNQYTDAMADHLVDCFKARMKSYDAVIINAQFSNSIHTAHMQEVLGQVLESVHCPVWLDSRFPLRYRNCSMKLNRHEISALTGIDDSKEAIRLLYSTHKGLVVMTRGEDGALAFDGTSFIDVLGVNIIKKTDPVGAGDAFLAALVCAQCCAMPVKESLTFANVAGAVSTEVLYATGHPTAGDILRVLQDTDYRYNPEIARDLRKADYVPGADIEVINKQALRRFRAYPKVAIFDHDGTISTMRQGWESVMSRMMVEAVAGERYATLEPKRLDEITVAVNEMIEKTTGIQTILQMEELAELVRHFGYVAPSLIQTPAQYKQEYHKRLTKLLDVKYERFSEGLYDVSDFTMKGALRFLQDLRSHGTKVFLASGTDYADVSYEMKTLGYGDVFDGGIYGSVGDVANDPKKMVMGTIINKLGDVGSDVVVFGDGPVEIREGKKRGFLTIGVASDEHQRYGWNLKKRQRLVLAGADVLVPDFSWMEKVSKLVGWKA